MSELAERTPESKESRGWGSYAVWAFVIFMLYVLSTGPILALNQHKPMNSKLMVVYAPFDWACNQKLLRKPLGVYWHLWAPKLYDKKGDRK